jgi:hypothetical protein
MARGKTTTTKATTKTATKTARVTTLEPKAGRALSSLEESVVRMHHGVSLKANAALASNAVTEELAAELLGREVDAHIATGRADELPDVPADERGAGKRPLGNQKTQKLLTALKKK